MAEQGFEYQAELNAIIAASKGQRPWYERIELSRFMNIKFAYLGVSVLSFVLMAIFGFVSMYVTDECKVEQPPPTRCCSCVQLNATQLDGQLMPMHKSLNSVFYGIVMVVNSVIGIYYVIVGLQNENKYQLFCMLITQLLECLRGIIDAVLEKVQGGETIDDAAKRSAREGLMYAALALCLLSAVLVQPVYKVFGWAVFRRGGAKHSTRQMYKTFQLFRALNRLDVQSSFMLFLIFIMYLRKVQDTWYIFLIIIFCDIMASRSMVRCLKQESLPGVVISAVAKCFVTIYWIIVIADYVSCYDTYAESRTLTIPWWRMGRAPDLESVYASYNGVNCLSPYTIHDARTFEVIMLNFAQAMVFRLTSLVASGFVIRNFGKGLKGVFYRIEERQQHTRSSSSVGRGKAVEEANTIEFKSKIKVKKAAVPDDGAVNGNGASPPAAKGTANGDYQAFDAKGDGEEDDDEDIDKNESGW